MIKRVRDLMDRHPDEVSLGILLLSLVISYILVCTLLVNGV